MSLVECVVELIEVWGFVKVYYFCVVCGEVYWDFELLCVLGELWKKLMVLGEYWWWMVVWFVELGVFEMCLFCEEFMGDVYLVMWNVWIFDEG